MSNTSAFARAGVKLDILEGSKRPHLESSAKARQPPYHASSKSVSLNNSRSCSTI